MAAMKTVKFTTLTIVEEVIEWEVTVPVSLTKEKVFAAVEAAAESGHPIDDFGHCLDAGGGLDVLYDDSVCWEAKQIGRGGGDTFKVFDVQEVNLA